MYLAGLGVKWDKVLSDNIVGWINESDQNKNEMIDFGEIACRVSRASYFWRVARRPVLGFILRLALVTMAYFNTSQDDSDFQDDASWQGPFSSWPVRKIGPPV